MRRIAAYFALGLAVAAPGAAETPARAAFFGLTFIDASLGASDAAERARLAMLEDRLVEALEASGRYAFVDPAPVAETLDLYANPAQCNGCDARLARELDAAVAVTGEVQKTSELILHITIYLRDAETGALAAGGSADIRGNTDESWRRGLDFILKRRILRE